MVFEAPGSLKHRTRQPSRWWQVSTDPWTAYLFSVLTRKQERFDPSPSPSGREADDRRTAHEVVPERVAPVRRFENDRNPAEASKPGLAE